MNYLCYGNRQPLGIWESVVCVKETENITSQRWSKWFSIKCLQLYKVLVLHQPGCLSSDGPERDLQGTCEQSKHQGQNWKQNMSHDKLWLSCMGDELRTQTGIPCWSQQTPYVWADRAGWAKVLCVSVSCEPQGTSPTEGLVSGFYFIMLHYYDYTTYSQLKIFLFVYPSFCLSKKETFFFLTVCPWHFW